MPAKRLFLNRRHTEVDMTEGSILGHIIHFAIPVSLGYLFQQLYNMVDAWVVGRFVSNEAYAAVGSVGNIIGMLISFFGGLSVGTGVVISQLFGAGRQKDVNRAAHTALLASLFMGIVFTVLGIALTPALLRMMNTPQSVYADAQTYLMIYFAGLLGLMIYNIGSGILRAIGDSQRPFYFLAVCAVANIVLDLAFVLVIPMGVAGVALATILSQIVSAVLVIITLLRTDACVKLEFKKLRIHKDLLRRIVTIGIPSAINSTITSFSNIFVQSYINFFGDNFMSGWSTYLRYDSLLALPHVSISAAVTTFVGQNLGKGQVDRAKKSVNISLLLGSASSVVLIVPLVIFREPLAAFFNGKEEVVFYASQLILYIIPSYVIAGGANVFVSALQGAGNTKVPTVIMLCCYVLTRQIYLFIISRIWNIPLLIAMGYPICWILCTFATGIYYYKVKFKTKYLMINR